MKQNRKLVGCLVDISTVSLGVWVSDLRFQFETIQVIHI